MIATIAGSNASIFFRSKEEAKLAPAAINPSALLPHAPAKIQISSNTNITFYHLAWSGVSPEARLSIGNEF